MPRPASGATLCCRASPVGAAIAVSATLLPGAIERRALWRGPCAVARKFAPQRDFRARIGHGGRVRLSDTSPNAAIATSAIDVRMRRLIPGQPGERYLDGHFGARAHEGVPVDCAAELALNERANDLCSEPRADLALGKTHPVVAHLNPQ